MDDSLARGGSIIDSDGQQREIIGDNRTAGEEWQYNLQTSSDESE